MNNKKDLMRLHLAVALFGMAGVIAKFLSWPSIAVCFGRVFISALFLIIFMSIRKEKIRLDSRRDYMTIVIAGIVMGTHWTAFIQSIQVSSVAIGTITFATFPLFVTILEPIVYKEKLKPINIIISIVMLIGVFITIPEFSIGNSTTVGVIWGMISSLTYAVLSLMNRYYSGKYQGRQICLYEQGVAAILLLPIVILMPSFSIAPSEIAAIIVLGIFCTAVAHSIFIASLNKVKVQTAGIISGLETVYGIIFAMILLHNMVTPREIIGGIIILSAATYKTVKESN